jgi:hypothetical protein
MKVSIRFLNCVKRSLDAMKKTPLVEHPNLLHNICKARRLVFGDLAVMAGASSGRPMVLRPRLSTGLPFSERSAFNVQNKTGLAICQAREKISMDVIFGGPAVMAVRAQR